MPALEQALETAYRYLNSRERTEAEMRAHLQGKDIGERAVERTIRALVEQGQLDDIRFARLFVQDKRELDGGASSGSGRSCSPAASIATWSRGRWPTPPRTRR